VVILFLLTSVLSLAVFIQPIKAAGGTIYICADGSIDPLIAPILSVDNITYTFTGNIYDSIVVERNNIVIDGNEYVLQGAGSGTGIDLYDRENVTVQNIQIKSFNHGIDLSQCENCFILSNKITLNERGVELSSSNFISIIENNIVTNNFGIRSAYCDYNTIRENNVTSNIQEGIYISFSYNNSISRNNVTNNYWSIYFHDSHFNSVQRNNITNNEYGFEIASSTDNSISGNRITNNRCGILLSLSSNNSVSGNNIENNDEGIFTIYSESTFNRIIGNNITNNQKGIKIKSFSNYNTISGNNITSNTQGIWLSDSFGNTIYHNNFVNNSAHAYSSNSINIWDNGFPSGGNYWSNYNGTDSDGDGVGDTPYIIDENNQDNYPLIDVFDDGTSGQTQYEVIYIMADGAIDPSTAPILGDGDVYTFTDNILGSIMVEKNNIVIDGNEYVLQGTGSGTGIDLSGRTNVTVQNTEIENFESGIRLDFSSSNNISRNNIANSRYGISIYDSFNNSINGNNVANNGDGIYLSSSSNNSVNGNNMANNEYGISLSSSNYNNISRNNITANIQAGIQLYSSSNNSINGNSITANNRGIYSYWFSNYNGISGNSITANNCGIYSSSYNDSIDGNNITANSEQGIRLSGSSNSISGNNISSNKKGIELYSSSNNSINANNITANNEYGIWLRDASDNIIDHNNFVANFRQVYSLGSISVWDDGYPSGGNYWSDYTGTDSDGDGVGNTPYVIDENNTDNQPLMAPICLFDAGTWEQTQYFVDCISNSTVSDFYFDPTEGAFLRFNVEGESGTSGFCRVTIPKELLHTEDDWVVLVDGASVTPTVNEDASNTYLYFTYNHSIKSIEIRGTTVIPEFQSCALILFTLTALAVAAAVYTLNPKKTDSMTINNSNPKQN